MDELTGLTSIGGPMMDPEVMAASSGLDTSFLGSAYEAPAAPAMPLLPEAISFAEQMGAASAGTTGGEGAVPTESEAAGTAPAPTQVGAPPTPASVPQAPATTEPQLAAAGGATPVEPIKMTMTITPELAAQLGEEAMKLLEEFSKI